MKPFFLLFLFLLIPIAYALPEASHESSISLTSFKNNPTRFFIAMNNTGNETMYNYTCSNSQYIIFDRIEQIDAQQQNNLTFTILTTDTFTNQNFPSSCTFLYKSMMDLPIKTWTVTYLNGSFYPYYTEASQGDMMQFQNNDSNPITIKEMNTLFPDTTIQPSQMSGAITLSSLNNYTFYHYLSGSAGIIEAKPRLREILVHNPSLDKSLTISLNSIYEESHIRLEIYQKEFEMSPFEGKEGVLKITNIANYPAVNLNFSMEWTTFTYLGNPLTPFNLNQNESRFINFLIQPNVTTTDQTNMTYEKMMYVSSPNINMTNDTIKVKVTYYNMSLPSPTGSRIVFVIDVSATIEFCKQNPNATQCDPLYKNFTKIVIQEKWINSSIPLTPEMIQMAQEGIFKGGYFIRYGNRLNEAMNITTDNVLMMMAIINQTLAYQAESINSLTAQLDDKNKSNRRIFIFVAAFIFIEIWALVVRYFWIKNKKESVVLGGEIT